MICPSCGKPVPDQSKFCPSCGATVQGAPGQPPVPYNPQPDLPMKWFKFVIWVQLFLAALYALSNAVRFLTGTAYGDETDLYYEMINGLRATDIVFGLMYVGVIVLAIYVRQQLAGFKKGAPEHYLRFIIIANAVGIAYSLAVIVVVATAVTNAIPGLSFSDVISMMADDPDVQSIFIQLVLSLILLTVMYVLNKIYFDKRTHLFVHA